MNSLDDTGTSKLIPLEQRRDPVIAKVPRALSPRKFEKENSSGSFAHSAQWKHNSSSYGIAGGPFPPLSPVHPNTSSPAPEDSQRLTRSASFEVGDDAQLGARGNWHMVESEETRSDSSVRLPETHNITHRRRPTEETLPVLQKPQAAVITSAAPQVSPPTSSPSDPQQSRNVSGSSWDSNTEQIRPLQYHHQKLEEDAGVSINPRASRRPQILHSTSDGPSIISTDSNNRPSSAQLLAPHSQTHVGHPLPRPSSAYSSNSELRPLSPGQTRSPQFSPHDPSRGPSPDGRPVSYIDLLNVPYPQPPPAPANFSSEHLRDAVGTNASLLGTKKTLDMYRANVKKTNDPTIQYEFAVFMINAAQELSAGEEESEIGSQAELLREARHILQRLSDRSYPFAQYYLADGYTSGLFHKGIEDYDRAFPLFISASKHGHAEAGYRAALCYEFGWGTRKDVQKAVQFYRQSASKNHPGASSRLGRACLVGDMGLGNRYREGLKWLKRAAESADFQYNSAPYELGLLHETGFGDDIFRDESYAAQLFTQSADLGHPEANFRLGDAYEHGKLSCPRDPALSVHFYTGAAQRGHPLGMMALCAWYMVGAEPVLEKDENEAYEWAKKAAETGLPKAQYAVGYFTEMGIGCRRDPLEANVWYVRAADQGDERATHRIAAIRAAASGGPIQPSPSPSSSSSPRGGKKEDGEKKGKKWGIF